MLLGENKQELCQGRNWHEAMRILKGGGFGYPHGEGDAAICFYCISASVGMTKPE
jgi:hypothetical protein